MKDIHTKTLWLLFSLLVSLALPGCATEDPFGKWEDTQLQEQVRAYYLTGEEATSRKVDAESDAEEAATPNAPRGESYYVDRAIARHPEIRAARQRVKQSAERIAQVQSLPDPTASISFGQMAETAAGQVEYILAVQQQLPYPGTLEGRAAVARKQVDEALRELEQVTEQVAGDTRRAYWSYFSASREIQVLQENRLLLEQIRETVEVRARVNKARQDDQLRVSRRLAALDNRIDELTQRISSATAMLKRQMSQGSTAPIAPPPAEEPLISNRTRDELVRTAEQHNPKVRLAQARAATFRSRLKLATVERLPDFSVGMQYGSVGSDGLSRVANGRDQVMGTVGVSIPLWAKKYDAAEREAIRGMGQAIAQVRAAQETVVFQVDDALARIEASQSILNRLRERLMPDAQQTIKLALTGYRTGEVDLLQLLNDFELLLTDQLNEARSIASLNRARADLKQAIGSTVDGQTNLQPETLQ